MKCTTFACTLLSLSIFLLVLFSSTLAQAISQPPASLPVESYSDDPLITSSAALCSLLSILGTETAAHGIGPLTVNPNCMSLTLQPHSTTSSVNAQTLPSSGIATIFQSSSSGVSISSAQPTTAPIVSSSSSGAGLSTSSSTASAPRATNAGLSQNRPPAVASWVAKHNIAVLLFSTFAVLAGVTYFLDELLGMLV